MSESFSASAAHAGLTAEIWVVDDDASIRFVLERALQRAGHSVRCFDDIDQIWQALQTQEPHVLLSDVRMPGGSGLDLMARAAQLYPALPVIIMTAHADLDNAVHALSGGAFEHVAKPFHLSHVVQLVAQAQGRRLGAHARADTAQALPQEEIITPSRKADSKRSTPSDSGPAAVEKSEVWPDLLGQSAAMQEVFRAIGRLSKSLATVLITGESGTGKELVARALHRHSPRGDKPFVAINTAAIPADLLESELFGHERGAFTGAQAQRPGRFEQAHGGTLFLDEIGDMPVTLQNRLLRVLSDGHFYRVGGQQLLKSDVRVIAATHQPLEDRVKQGLFREDLLHRLNVIRLRLPPLRERVEDITALAQFFLSNCAPRLGVAAKQLSAAAAHKLQTFEFPGNVRQLENMCQWMTIMAPGAVISVDNLPPEVLMTVASGGGHTPHSAVADDSRQTIESDSDDRLAAKPLSTQVTAPWSQTLFLEALQQLRQAHQQPAETEVAPIWDALMQEAEQALIRAALQVTKGRRIEAAQLLGVGRNTLSRKLAQQAGGLAHKNRTE